MIKFSKKKNLALINYPEERLLIRYNSRIEISMLEIENTAATTTKNTEK